MMNRKKMKNIHKVKRQLGRARGQEKVLLHEKYLNMVDEVKKC